MFVDTLFLLLLKQKLFSYLLHNKMLISPFRKQKFILRELIFPAYLYLLVTFYDCLNSLLIFIDKIDSRAKLNILH